MKVSYNVPNRIFWKNISPVLQYYRRAEVPIILLYRGGHLIRGIESPGSDQRIVGLETDRTILSHQRVRIRVT